MDQRLAPANHAARPPRPPRLDPPIRRRILEALDQLAADPRAANLVKLTGRPESRLRVGDWRVLVRLDHHQLVVVVIHIRPRGRAYRD
ncbi:MAG: type II toxin-antitoxin system RelE family toxin [Solirubrobacteraceae bacterium]